VSCDMQSRERLVLDTSAMPRQREVEVYGFVLDLVASEARTFETDVPLSEAHAWP